MSPLEFIISLVGISVAAGATRKEILEAAGVAVLMGGGPAFTHVAEVIKALDALNAA